MNPITLPPPVWPPMHDGRSAVIVNTYIMLRVRQHPRHPSDLFWSVLVGTEAVAASDEYIPMSLEEAQAAAWDALAKWLGAE